MTDINYFEYAINQNETNDFFRGKGKYLIPSPDYEGHVHGAHMGGCINTFVSESDGNAEKFRQAFLGFLQDLKPSTEDVNHLLANISSYFAQRSRGNLIKSTLFINKNSEEFELLKNYISDICRSSIYKDIEQQLARHAKFIEGKGSSILQDCIQQVMAI